MRIIGVVQSMFTNYHSYKNPTKENVEVFSTNLLLEELGFTVYQSLALMIQNKIMVQSQGRATCNQAGR